MIIKELTIETADVKGTIAFYKDILGLHLVYQTTFKAIFKVGFTQLMFVETTQSHPFYHFAFSIPTNKVDEAHAFIAKRTTILSFTPETTIADFSNWNAHAFYFLDTQGNIVEFIAHHDLENATSEPFSPEHILGVCEIGIPVDDVTEACKVFNEQYGVPYYVKGPRLKDFSVMGDELGLFIVTRLGRGWLPTMQPSERFYTKVLFENNYQETEYIVG